MRPQALFFNGNFEGNLQCIADVQSILPEQILFIQPLMNRDIAYLRDNPPSVDDPVTLYASLFSDEKKISYTGEIVGWEIKSEISTEKRNAIEKILNALQPKEGGLYHQGRNLLQVRRVEQSFLESNLIKISDGKPMQYSPRPGGFSYVYPLKDTPPSAER